MKALLAIALVTACSGGGSGSSARSGLPESQPLVQLDTTGKDDLCAYQVEVEGTAPTSCGSGASVTPKTKAECIAALGMLTPTCTATVSSAEDCFEALGANPCGFGGSACNALVACSMSP